MSNFFKEKKNTLGLHALLTSYWLKGRKCGPFERFVNLIHNFVLKGTTSFSPRNYIYSHEWALHVIFEDQHNSFLSPLELLVEMLQPS